MMNLINTNFKWNREYLIKHRLDEDVLKANGIQKEHRDEEFFEIKKDYYVSQYGNAISLKKDAILMKKSLYETTAGKWYYNYTFDSSMGAHRAVAELFCPNFWKDQNQNKLKLEAHHVDGNGLNNDYRNLVLLPQKLHKALEKIRKIILLKDDGTFVTYKNPLDLVYDTGLTLEQIIYANKDGRRKAIKAKGYTVYNVKGFLLGFKYYPQKDKKKKVPSKK